jgi:hypothetical protein
MRSLQSLQNPIDPCEHGDFTSDRKSAQLLTLLSNGGEKLGVTCSTEASIPYSSGAVVAIVCIRTISAL